MSQEFDFPFADAPLESIDVSEGIWGRDYTIEWRHILAAIPGDTNRDKLSWVQAATAGRDTGGSTTTSPKGDSGTGAGDWVALSDYERPYPAVMGMRMNERQDNLD